MDKKKDPMERIILDDFQMEAEMIKKEVQEANVEAMPPEVKDKIRERLHEKKAEREREKLYAQLSEEDKKALELGREMLKKQEADKREEKVVCFKKPKKMYIALAAVMVLVLAMGVTSVGGPKRAVQMIQAVIGDRELIQVNSDEDNYIVENDKEEEAYEKLKDVFGVEPVKVFHQLDGMEFVTVEIDEELQTAFLIYNYQEDSISYFMSSQYTDSSWGIDVEDTVSNEYCVEHKEKGKIKITEYEIEKTGEKKYFARFTHDGLEYFLAGAIHMNDFEELVKNLKFF